MWLLCKFNFHRFKLIKSVLVGNYWYKRYSCTCCNEVKTTQVHRSKLNGLEYTE